MGAGVAGGVTGATASGALAGVGAVGACFSACDASIAGAAGAPGWGAATRKRCPHDAQNLPGFIRALHDGQAIRLAKEVPHSLQNLAPSLLSALHEGHVRLIDSLYLMRLI